MCKRLYPATLVAQKNSHRASAAGLLLDYLGELAISLDAFRDRLHRRVQGSCLVSQAVAAAAGGRSTDYVMTCSLS